MFGNTYKKKKLGCVHELYPVLSVSNTMCVNAQDIGGAEAPVIPQLTHTPLFVAFRTSYRKIGFIPNFSPSWKSKMVAVER